MINRDIDILSADTVRHSKAVTSQLYADTVRTWQRLTADLRKAESRPPSTGNQIHYDGEISGFGLRVTASGSKSFVLNYRFNGQERRYTIGPFPEFSVETARNKAFELRQSISNGVDPFTLTRDNAS